MDQNAGWVLVAELHHQVARLLNDELQATYSIRHRELVTQEQNLQLLRTMRPPLGKRTGEPSTLSES